MSAAAELFGGRYETISRYVDLLASDGVERGLIGPREADRLWDRHILNSVALAELVPPGAFLVDVGSGAGLPGIPLAVLRPDIVVTLLEPLLRRSVFLTEAVETLGITGSVRVIRSRAEDHDDVYDVVTARALAPLERLIGWCDPLRADKGVILAMKGRSVDAEIADARDVLARHRLSATTLVVRAHPDAETTTVVRLSGTTR